jgi:phospholipid/cholesterol/gamma-HCH transport system substrate-binding protein
MQTKNIERIVGIFILGGILALLVLAFQISGVVAVMGKGGYEIKAAFDNIGDLRVRAPVSIDGVRIGQVTGIKLNPSTFKADVTMHIEAARTIIPADSTASILTQGLLGSNYISLTPGFANTALKNNGIITTTHSAVILENLIGQLMYKLDAGKSK